MRILSALLPISILTVCCSSLFAGSIAVSGSATILGGTAGTWGFSYDSGDPGLYLKRITIDLGATDLAFDTAAGGFGSLNFLDVGGYAGTDGATGLSGITATGSGLDGGKALMFGFDNFLPGGFFQFTADIDHPNPTLLTLQNCSGKTGLALTACLLTNATRTVTNNTRLLAAEFVLASQLSGAIISYDFEGYGFADTTAQGGITSSILPNSSGGFAASVEEVPEPGSLALLGSGFLGIAMLWKRRAIRG